MSELMIKAAETLLVMPATNSISERSFSAMNRVKTYLRSTTTDDRMSHLMVLHVQQERVWTMLAWSVLRINFWKELIVESRFLDNLQTEI